METKIMSYIKSFEMPKSRLIKAGIITAVYALLTLFTISRHEMFQDEINVWMLLRNLDFISFVKYLLTMEPHPFLFFSLNAPFVSLGVNAVSVQAVSWTASVLAVFILNVFSPFSLLVNIIITASAPMIYFYPVVARCYSLLPPLLFALAAIYDKAAGNEMSGTILSRQNIPAFAFTAILILITQTHILMLPFCFALFSFFIYDKYKKGNINAAVKLCAAAFSVSAVLVSAQIIATKTLNNSFSVGYYYSGNIYKYISVPFLCQFFDSMKGDLFKYGREISFTPANICLLAITIMLLLSVFVILEKKNKRMFAVFLIFAASQFAVYRSYPVIYPYRTYIFHLVIIFCFWTIYEKKHDKRISAILGLLMLISIPTGFHVSYKDWNDKFSSSEEIASAIEKTVPRNDSIIIATVQYSAIPVAYHLRKTHKIYSTDSNEIRFLKGFELPDTINTSGILNGKKHFFILAPDYQKDFFSGNSYKIIYETSGAMTATEDYILAKPLEQKNGNANTEE